jgi:hypothetical protein
VPVDPVNQPVGAARYYTSAMRSALSARIPVWVVFSVALAVITGVAALSLALREEPSPPSAAGGARQPMRVPRFIAPEAVSHRPRFMFTFDSPGALEELRASEHLDDVIAGATTDLERFRRLTAWARAQFEPGVPDPYPPLDARIILRDIRSGFTGGFCAQYNYVLAQSIMSMGYPARYVTVVDHEVIEGWLRDERRWVCLDPLYSATYVNETGRALSVLDLRRRAEAGQAILPGPGSLPGTARKVKGAFARFAVWIRNDHITRPINFTDIQRYKVVFLGNAGETVESGLLSTALEADLYFDPDAL